MPGPHLRQSPFVRRDALGFELIAVESVSGLSRRLVASVMLSAASTSTFPVTERVSSIRFLSCFRRFARAADIDRVGTDGGEKSPRRKTFPVPPFLCDLEYRRQAHSAAQKFLLDDHSRDVPDFPHRIEYECIPLQHPKTEQQWPVGGQSKLPLC
jgi:hypothetical protein